MPDALGTNFESEVSPGRRWFSEVLRWARNRVPKLRPRYFPTQMTRSRGGQNSENPAFIRWDLKFFIILALSGLEKINIALEAPLSERVADGPTSRLVVFTSSSSATAHSDYV